MRLRDEIDRLATSPSRSADICRAIGEQAEEQGVRRPSYEQVRVLIHEHRDTGLAPTAGQILLDVALRTRPPQALLELLE